MVLFVLAWVEGLGRADYCLPCLVSINRILIFWGSFGLSFSLGVIGGSVPGAWLVNKESERERGWRLVGGHECFFVLFGKVFVWIGLDMVEERKLRKGDFL